MSSAHRLLAVISALIACSASGRLEAQPSLLTLLDPVSTLEYGPQAMGASGALKMVTLSNSGQAPLVISGVALAGVHPDEFNIVDDDCGGSVLDPDATCTIVVEFAPLSAGPKSARLRVTSTAPGSAHEVPLAGSAVDPTQPARQAGPVDLRHGFPLWYEDEAGARLTLCLDATGLCISEPPDPTQPPSVTDASLNFPEEAFWWYAEAEIDRPQRGARMRLILAKEATFLEEQPAVGQQIVFDRVRVRANRLVPGETYVVTHPFGVETLTADEDGEIDFTSDIGCALLPCDFRFALAGAVREFLRWDPTVPPAAPTGHLGDPRVPHRVVGSPTGQNFFRVVGLSVGGPGSDSVETDLFHVSGKLQ